MVGGVQAHHRGQNRGYHHIHPRSTQHLAWQKILQSEANVAHQGQKRYARGKQAGEKDADGGADTELDTDIKLYKVQLSRRKLRLPQVLRSRRVASGCRMDKGRSTPPHDSAEDG